VCRRQPEQSSLRAPPQAHIAGLHGSGTRLQVSIVASVSGLTSVGARIHTRWRPPRSGKSETSRAVHQGTGHATAAPDAAARWAGPAHRRAQWAREWMLVGTRVVRGRGAELPAAGPLRGASTRAEAAGTRLGRPATPRLRVHLSVRYKACCSPYRLPLSRPPPSPSLASSSTRASPSPSLLRARLLTAAAAPFLGRPAHDPPASSPPAQLSSLIMPAKKRCQFTGEEKCNSAVLRLVGQCPHCRAEFCGNVRPAPCEQPIAGADLSIPQHRLPEYHSCTNLESCKQQAFEKNKAKLEAERTVAPKMAMT
jgi:hypothetical protein